MNEPRQAIAADVLAGLTAQPKRLPSRLFYDARGSELFERITRLPEYYPTRTELAILERYAKEMIAAAGTGLTVVELGAGSGFKTRLLLKEVLARQAEATFYPVDISPAALEMAARSLRGEFPRLLVMPLLGRYRPALAQLRGRPGPMLMLFLGSSIGNADLLEGAALLRDVRQALPADGALLLGTDQQKDPSILVPAYDDAQGVTAQFNKNVLVRINRELGGHFNLGAFRHVAVWNGAASRMEMHLESLAGQRVSIDAMELEVRFEAGERIHTENSYKYTRAMLEGMVAAGGFRLARRWQDERGWFEVSLLRPGCSSDGV